MCKCISVCEGYINASYYDDDSWTCGGNGASPLGSSMRYHQREKLWDVFVTWTLFAVSVFDHHSAKTLFIYDIG